MSQRKQVRVPKTIKNSQPVLTEGPETLPVSVILGVPDGPTARLVAAAETFARSYPGAGRLAALVELRALLDELLAPEVAVMRTRHGTWADIARVLGVSAQAAQQRYGKTAALG